MLIYQESLITLIVKNQTISLAKVVDFIFRFYKEEKLRQSLPAANWIYPNLQGFNGQVGNRFN